MQRWQNLKYWLLCLFFRRYLLTPEWKQSFSGCSEVWGSVTNCCRKWHGEASVDRNLLYHVLCLPMYHSSGGERNPGKKSRFFLESQTLLDTDVVLSIEEAVLECLCAHTVCCSSDNICFRHLPWRPLAVLVPCIKSYNFCLGS